MELYHGSNETIEAIKSNKGIYGGIFATNDKDTALSHGNILHVIEVDEDKILSNAYDIDYESAKAAILNEITVSEEDFDEIYDIIMHDASIFRSELSEEKLLNIFPATDLSEASWEAQRIKGVVAKKLGYDAVEGRDEHGTTYLVLNCKSIKAE